MNSVSASLPSTAAKPKRALAALPRARVATALLSIRCDDWTRPLCLSNSRSMDKRAFSVRGILAGEAPQGAPVTIKGWVRTRRDSKAGISFVHLSDGSSFHPLQVVAPNTLANYTGEVLRLTAGCAVEATGAIVPSPAKGQPFESQANRVPGIGWVGDPDPCPFPPKPPPPRIPRAGA